VGLAGLSGDISRLDREILKKLEVYRILRVNVTPDLLASSIPLEREIILSALDRLVDSGYVDETYRLTQYGRRLIRVGLIGGVFDILHPGHIATLEAAKARVDLLSVVVARDRTVFLNKRRMPLNNEGFRLKMVSSLKPVDVAILGSVEDFMEPVRLIKPDVIFLGYDQSLPKQVSKELDINGVSIEKLEIEVPGIKSSMLLRKVLDLLGY